MELQYDQNNEIDITIGEIFLQGFLYVPRGMKGVVLFAHGSGSGRYSPRNQFVAQVLQKTGVGTLLLDLLTREEEEIDMLTGHLRFDIGLLAERLAGATDWLGRVEGTRSLNIGYFGASTGAAAALVAAAKRKNVQAIVSRGGRPDLAGDALLQVEAPTLLIVGGNDYGVIELNQEAFDRMEAEKELKIVPGATHLFEEPGTLEQVASLASDWFVRYLF